MSGFIENMGNGIPIVSCTKAVYRNGYYVPSPAVTVWGMKRKDADPATFMPEHKRTPTRANTDPILSRAGYGEYYL